MKKISFALTVMAVFLFAACSKNTSPGKSAKVKPKTYTADMVPLLQLKCSPCHLPSKGGNKANFENYEIAKKSAADILARVSKNPGERGFMPMKHDKLSVAEIEVIKNWIEKGLLEK